MSTANKITAGEIMRRANRRTFLSYLGAAPALTAFAGAGLLSSQGLRGYWTAGCGGAAITGASQTVVGS